MKKILIILILAAGALFILSGVFSHKASQDYSEAAEKWERAGNILNSNMCIAVANSYSAKGNRNVVIGVALVVIGLGSMASLLLKNKR